MLFQLYFSAITIVSITNAVIDDTPFNNFTWLMTKYKEKCVKLPAFKLARDRKLYEGRWYGVEASYNKVQADTLSCYHWDSFFDKENNLHDFFYLKEDGRQTLMVVKGQPLKEADGLYDNNLGKSNDWENVFTTLYYVDKKIIVRWYVQCSGNGTENRDFEVGYRDLKYVTEKAGKVRELMGRVEAEIGKFDKNKISHKHCDYQPEMKNPYV